jgi:NAD(P)-dependent dehydrogenase (short-subunit alcohol dehydrogenase family)
MRNTVVQMRSLAVITGGSRGIGSATANRLAHDGWDLVITYLSDEQSARQVADELGSITTVHVVQADVGIEADVLRLFNEVDRMGNLGALINNAGIVGQKARVDEYTVERIQRMFAVNTFGTMMCCREAVKRMSTRHGGNGGRIVNVSSRASQLGSPGEYVDYAAAKAAVDTFTLGLAKEVAEEGILVNGVRPGIVDTDIHASGGQPDRASRLAHLVPLQRPGRAEEIAAAIAFLCSPEASYLCGSMIDVGGGR